MIDSLIYKASLLFTPHFKQLEAHDWSHDDYCHQNNGLRQVGTKRYLFNLSFLSVPTNNSPFIRSFPNQPPRRLSTLSYLFDHMLANRQQKHPESSASPDST